MERRPGLFSFAGTRGISHGFYTDYEYIVSNITTFCTSEHYNGGQEG
jgi:hypothetical protein